MKIKRTYILSALLLIGIITSGCMPEVMRLYNEGNQAAWEGKYHETLSAWEEELRLFKEQENQPGVAEVMGNISGIYIALQQYDKALSYLEEALKIYRKMKEPLGTAFVLHNIGAVYSNMGQYNKALSYFEESLSISRNVTVSQMLKQPIVTPHIRETMAKFFERAIPNVTAGTLENMGRVYLNMGQYDRASAYFEEALLFKTKCGCPPAGVLYNIGQVHLARKKYTEAEEKFLEAGKGLNDNIKRTIGINLSLAKIYLETGKYEKALSLIKETTPLWYDTEYSNMNFYTVHGVALNKTGRLGEASREFLKSVLISEEMRQKVKEKTEFFGRENFMRGYKELIVTLSERAIKGEKTDEGFSLYGKDLASNALYFSEATKARTLLETIAASGQKQNKTEIPVEIGNKEKDIINQLSLLESQWENTYKSGEEGFKRLIARKAALKKELNVLTATISKEYPIYAALYYPKPIPAEDLPLKGNEALIEYAVTDDVTFAFVVRKGGVKNLIKIPLGKEALEEKIKAFMEPLNTGQYSQFSVNTARKLYDTLLASALKDVKDSEKVIIIPDGILGLLPFEALVINEGKDIKDSLYVGDKWTITYSQSATALALTRMLRPSQAGKPLFALGNPVFDKEDPRYIAFKKGQQPALLAQNTNNYAYRGITLRPKEIKIENSKTDIKWEEAVYTPLPETETEVKEIAKLFNTKTEFPDILLSITANETNLKKVQLKDYRYLHFATHADLPGKVQGINEPFLLLGQVENEKQDDGFLTLSEVLGMNLDSEMVVLSACVTGKGKIMEGEGVANFARAFQHAGSRSVVVSLWEVPSKETVEYMKKFYGYIKAGKSRGEALRLARNEIKSKYPNPFYWAVFILHGEG